MQKTLTTALIIILTGIFTLNTHVVSAFEFPSFSIPSAPQPPSIPTFGSDTDRTEIDTPTPTKQLMQPTSTPTKTPTATRSVSTPTQTPSKTPTKAPSATPTRTPTKSPQSTPTRTPTKTPTPTLFQSAITLDEKQTYIMNEINQYRAGYGLYAVKTDPYTCNFAKARAKEISVTFNHDLWRERVDDGTLPYPEYSRVTENLAMTSDYRRVVTMWRNSSGHAKNMRADTPFVCVESYGNYFAYEGWKP
jgi:uncharacterized protein YkwD